VPLSDVSGTFWFFGAENTELVVKLIDACDYNGRRWVYGGADRWERRAARARRGDGCREDLHQSAGAPVQPIVDSDAFDCSDIPHSRGRGAIRRGAKELERDSRGPAAPPRGTTTQPGG